ncbi:MAG: TonB-dependent siderophore receptor [Gammaproteobacteria bacterium]|nr:TonB-dependent siderophore receptor [Gammaproteobacteria bacterium]MCY4357441.1 TonB-dependent siderophore receptor [Gammaproteobacteria bacterium]
MDTALPKGVGLSSLDVSFVLENTRSDQKASTDLISIPVKVGLWTSRLLQFCLLASGFTLITLVPKVALAQQNASEEIESIFVMGQRRAYQGNFDELENPTSVQLIDSELLREIGALNLNDALDLSASVARQNNFGGLWNSFSVRGFSGDINLPSAFLVNGFNAGRGFGGPRDIVGIESVEVLKGPRGALFGRGEPGGTVNLITKRPQFETAGDFRTTLGSWNQLRLEGDVQTTAGVNDQVGIRLVGFYEDSESFRETVEIQRLGFYPSVTWDISDQTSLTYEMELTQQEIPFDRGVVYAPEFGFSPRETFAGEPGDGPIETDVFGHQLEFQHNFSENWSLLAGLGYRDTSFSGNASESNFGGRQTYFLDGRTLSRFFRYRDFNSDYTVLRAELAGEFETGSLRHRILFGADHDDFDNRMFILRYRPGWFGPNGDINALDPDAYLLLDLFNPVYGQSPQPVPGPNTNRVENLSGTGIYIQDQIDITDRFQIRLGLRWDDFEQDLTNLRANPATTVTASDSRVSPQLGAVYLVNDSLSLFASYGEGFRQQSGSDFQGNQFDPNLTESAEVGFKWDMMNFASGVTGALTLAAFRVDQSNILVNDDRPEAVAAGFFSLPAGEARSRGVELDANFSTDSGFNFWFSYAYTNAEYTTNNLEADWGVLIEAGDSLINSPENQLNIQASKDFQFNGLPAQIGGGFLHTDERAGFTGFPFMLPSYTTARLFGQVALSEGLTLRVDVDNVFDEEFYTNSYADVWVEPGAPTRWRFTASYQF